MGSRTKLGICAALVLGAVTSAQAGTIFTDDFDAGASALWGNGLGGWFASGGVYDAAFPSNNPPTHSLLPFALTDFSIDVDINDVQDGGIWLRSDATGTNGVLLVTGGLLGVGTGFYFHDVQGGSYGPILDNSAAGLITPGVSDIHLRVDVVGSTYSVFMNGGAVPVATHTTALFASGRVGLYDFSRQTFDNVVVATPDAVPLPSSALMGLGLLAAVGGAGGLARRRRRQGV